MPLYASKGKAALAALWAKATDRIMPKVKVNQATGNRQQATGNSQQPTAKSQLYTSFNQSCQLSKSIYFHNNNFFSFFTGKTARSGCLYVGGHCTHKFTSRRMKMKNTIKLLGIIALVAVIGFSFTACGSGSGDDDGDGNPFVGTWKGSSL